MTDRHVDAAKICERLRAHLLRAMDIPHCELRPVPDAGRNDADLILMGHGLEYHRKKRSAGGT